MKSVTMVMTMEYPREGLKAYEEHWLAAAIAVGAASSWDTC